MRGRAVELMTESKNDLLRVAGVVRLSSSKIALGAGVCKASLEGLGTSKRARGRGKAGVGVIAKDGAAVDVPPPFGDGNVRGTAVLLLNAAESASPSDEKVGS